MTYPTDDGFGAKIRDMRRNRGWRLQDLATASGLSLAYLSQIENGKRRPSLTSVALLRAAFGEPILQPMKDVLDGMFIQKWADLLLLPQMAEIGDSNEGRVLFESGQFMLWRTILRERLGPTESVPGLLVAHVLSGSCRIEFADETIILETKDTVSFDSTRTRSWTPEVDEADLMLLLVTVQTHSANLAD